MVQEMDRHVARMRSLLAMTVFFMERFFSTITIVIASGTK